ncbi:MAG: hypothetical protein ACTHJU_16385 [Sphingopyxis sp.]
MRTLMATAAVFASTFAPFAFGADAAKTVDGNFAAMLRGGLELCPKIIASTQSITDDSAIAAYGFLPAEAYASGHRAFSRFSDGQSMIDYNSAEKQCTVFHVGPGFQTIADAADKILTDEFGFKRVKKGPLGDSIGGIYLKTEDKRHFDQFLVVAIPTQNNVSITFSKKIR